MAETLASRQAGESGLRERDRNIVVVAILAGVSNEVTENGVALFLWARVAHAIVYIAGVPYLRTLAYAASLGGLLRIAAQVLVS